MTEKAHNNGGPADHRSGARTRAGRASYDTYVGINDAICMGGLKAFWAICEARREAGYERRERLKDWLVDGRYYLDTCGNVWLTVERVSTPERVSSDPGACRSGGRMELRPFAPHNKTCPRCGQGWTLADAHDYAELGGRRHLHSRCFKLEVADRARADFEFILTDAGVEQPVLAVPNRYGSEDWNGPWFTFHHTSVGRVTLGWRKRVIHIEWERGPDGHILFEQESVTKGSNHIHAWSTEKASKYLRLILSDGVAQE